MRMDSAPPKHDTFMWVASCALFSGLSLLGFAFATTPGTDELDDDPSRAASRPIEPGAVTVVEPCPTRAANSGDPAAALDGPCVWWSRGDDERSYVAYPNGHILIFPNEGVDE